MMRPASSNTEMRGGSVQRGQSEAPAHFQLLLHTHLIVDIGAGSYPLYNLSDAVAREMRAPDASE